MNFDSLHDTKEVILREHAITVHADIYSKYVDLEGWHDNVFEIDISADANLDGSNYWVPTLMYATATPGTIGSYAAVAAADMDYEVVVAAGTSTFYSNTVLPTINSTSVDSVILRARYKGTARYVCVFMDVTTAGSYPTGVLGIRATVSRGRTKPEDTYAVTIGTVS